VANPVTTRPLVDRDRADLSEILPHNVQRSAANDVAEIRTLGDAELLDVFVEIHGGLVEQAPGSYVLVDQGTDYMHVAGARLPDCVPHRGTTVSSVFQWLDRTLDS
jgi:hypothetical protein